MGELEVTYVSNKIEKVCKIERETRKVWGPDFVRPVQNRISQLEAADCLGDLVGTGAPGRWELMTGDRLGQASAHLTANYRLIMKVEGSDANEIRHVEVLGREDYH